MGEEMKASGRGGRKKGDRGRFSAGAAASASAKQPELTKFFTRAPKRKSTKDSSEENGESGEAEIEVVYSKRSPVMENLTNVQSCSGVNSAFYQHPQYRFSSSTSSSASSASFNTSQHFMSPFDDKSSTFAVRARLSNLNLEDVINPTFRTRPPTPFYLKQQPPRSGLPRLPSFDWTDSQETWNLMCWKEKSVCAKGKRDYQKSHLSLTRHPTIMPRMRSILLDWMTEVCEVYKLHRDTYYLAVDFLDRYLARSPMLDKNQLQLVGTTALFMAAKMEEIYPPKCSDFAFVTDGACSETQITQHELVMASVLEWALSPVTVSHWLLTYLQLAIQNTSSSSTTNQLLPQSKIRDFFVQLCRLVDLCTMDVGSCEFGYGEIAASAIHHMIDPSEMAFAVSGFNYEELKKCIDWMSPFASTLSKDAQVELKMFTEVREDDCHNIQTHEISMALFDRAMEARKKMTLLKQSSTTPDVSQCLDLYPTPPNSEERPSPTLIPPRIPVYYNVDNSQHLGVSESRI